VLDPDLIKRIASDLRSEPNLIEKDWHVLRAIGVIAQVDHGGMMPAFSGGTSLSKAWELIKRFSEDVDFKVGEPASSSASRARRARTAYRERVLQALTGAGFELEGKPVGGNESRYFAADLAYGGEFGAGQGLRPHIRVEMSFQAPALPPVARPIRSLIASSQEQPPEVRSFARPGDDPTIVRHLHDLAALERRVASAPRFPELVLAAVAADEGRGGAAQETNASTMFAEMLRRLETDALWAREYETACDRLVKLCAAE
jgi:hypothetical protein